MISPALLSLLLTCQEAACSSPRVNELLCMLSRSSWQQQGVPCRAPAQDHAEAVLESRGTPIEEPNPLCPSWKLGGTAYCATSPAARVDVCPLGIITSDFGSSGRWRARRQLREKEIKRESVSSICARLNATQEATRPNGQHISVHPAWARATRTHPRRPRRRPAAHART